MKKKRNPQDAHIRALKKRVENLENCLARFINLSNFLSGSYKEMLREAITPKKRGKK